MPCCQWVLSVAASSRSSTPSWLRRLHAKGGLSIPSDLRMDDILYGQSPPPPPPPPPPSPPIAIVPPQPPASADHHDTNPPTNPKPRRYPSRSNPSGGNKRNPPQPQQQPPPEPSLSGIISSLFVVPSAPRSSRPLKPFRKQHRPCPRPDDKSPPPPHKDAKDKIKSKTKACPRPDDKSLPPPHKDAKDKAKSKTKAKKHRRAVRSAEAEGERRFRTEVTVIDSSIDGWKAAKVLIRRGTVWKIRNNKNSGISEPDDLNKGKRKAGLITKILRDKQKGKDGVLLGDNRAKNGDIMKESDNTIQVLKRRKYSDLEGQSTEILLLQSTPKDISEGGSGGK